ncbi:MAG: CapA family protein [Oscillospiraceae bacterium]|nr:CapA family protein [Oscillospiraceae bacterium]
MSENYEKTPGRPSFINNLLIIFAVLVLGFSVREFVLAKKSAPEHDVLLEQIESEEFEEDFVEEPIAEPEEEHDFPDESSRYPSNELTLMALGDNLIHNSIYWSAEQPDGTYDFTPMYADIAPIAQQYDIACINQETIFVNDPNLYGNYPQFGTPTAVGDALAEAGFDVVTHATNHAYDKLMTGINDTINFWHENHPQISAIGIHDSEESAKALNIIERNGIRIALLNYAYGLTYLMPEQPYTVKLLADRDAIAAEIINAKERADFVIVFVHWGEDGGYTPTQEQRDWAQFFVTQGVGAVIGSHSHILQPVEGFATSDGRVVPVFYSLGNFLSHQMQPQNRLGGMASMTIGRDENGVYVKEYALTPTVNVMMRREEGWFNYRPMLLEHYTDELAAKHRLQGMDVASMWSLYHSIINSTTSAN